MQYKLMADNQDDNLKEYFLVYEKKVVNTKKSKDTQTYYNLLGVYSNIDDEHKYEISQKKDLITDSVIGNEIKDGEEVFLLSWVFSDGDSYKSLKDSIFENIFLFKDESLAIDNKDKILIEYDFLKINIHNNLNNLQKYFEENNYSFDNFFRNQQDFNSQILTDNHQFLNLSYYVFYDYFVNLSKIKINKFILKDFIEDSYLILNGSQSEKDKFKNKNKENEFDFSPYAALEEKYYFKIMEKFQTLFEKQKLSHISSNDKKSNILNKI